jgi:hypothetical protein
VLYVFGFFHILRSFGISEMAPLEKTQNGNTYNV